MNRLAAPSVPDVLEDVSASWLTAALSETAPGTVVEQVEPAAMNCLAMICRKPRCFCSVISLMP